MLYIVYFSYLFFSLQSIVVLRVCLFIFAYVNVAHFAHVNLLLCQRFRISCVDVVCEYLRPWVNFNQRGLWMWQYSAAGSAEYRAPAVHFSFSVSAFYILILAGKQ